MDQVEKIRFIEEAIKHLFNIEVALNPADKLVDLSLDSLNIVELQMYYEETTGNELDTDDVVVTVGDLIELMK